MALNTVVLVGNSKRFPKKHLMRVGEKRLIDIVVENLMSMEFDVFVYSKYEFPISVPIIYDDEPWILPSLIHLLKEFGKGIFVFGGDMPLIRREAVEKMIPHVSHTAVVPRWKNGYLEPLHAYYSPRIINAFEKEMKYEKPSLHDAILKCKDVHYVRAESMPELTFFNVNVPEDLESLKNIMKNAKIF